MHLTKEYVDLQVRFVKKLCEIDKAPFDLYFMIYADAPNMLRMDFKIWHPNLPDFREFSNLLVNSTDYTTTIYDFAIKKLGEIPRDPFKSPYGFFYRNILKSAFILEMHTQYDEPILGIHPLDHRRFEETKGNLYTMMKEAKEKFPNLTWVTGNSWLYNIEAYRRLFPKEYLDTGKFNTHSFHGLGLWGQFLNKGLQIKKDVAEEFYKKLDVAQTFEQAMEAFPYMVIGLKAPIDCFLK